MAVVNGDNFIRGNTVLVPAYKPSRKFDDEKYKKLDKAKKEAQIKLRKQQTKSKLRVLQLIVVAFVMGIVLMYRYVTIYNMEAGITKVKANIVNVNAENESLKLVLAKNSSIKAVEDTAVNNLHMIKASSADVLKINLNKNNFNVAKDNSDAPQSLFDKLKQLLF